MQKPTLKKTYRGGSSDLAAVCSPRYHNNLKEDPRYWVLFVAEIGEQHFPPDPPVMLGNCPCCRTTLTKASK
jgi:hypothetical protein